MPSFTVATSGQTLIVTAVAGLASGTPTLYTSSALSSSVTLPAVITSDTTYYLREPGAKVTVTQTDGTTIASAQPVFDGGTLTPVPTFLQTVADASFDVNFLLNGSPTGTFRTNLPDRFSVTSDVNPLTSGVLFSTPIVLMAGDIVTNLTFCSGGTAANTPTHWFFALYDTASTPALIAQTADQTSTAWGADTPMTVALSSPYTVTATGVYYAGIMVTATTKPTLVGKSLARATDAAAVLTGQKVTGQTSGSGLTTTAPATIASPTAVTSVPYVIAT